MDRTGIIIQARLGSKRLPKKMIIPFYEEKGILECLLGNLTSALLQPIVVATTDKAEDDAIEDLVKGYGVECFRGDERNVLNRFIQCAEKYSFNRIIRICADNPFLDIPSLIHLIDKMNNCEVDYLSYALSTGVPVIQTHYGFWAEGVTLKALKVVAKSTNDCLFTEHVTNFIYSSCSRDVFNISWIEVPNFIEESDIRLTIDTQQDFVVARDIYNEFMKFEERSLRRLVSFVLSHQNYLAAMKEQISLNKK